MIIHDFVQGSDEWIQVRLGKVTASKFSDVMAKGAGKTRKTYMIQLATEIMEQIPVVSYFDKNMEAGQEKETAARRYYEMITDCPVKEVGFVQLDDNVGASPDGLIGTDGGVEIKCPTGKVYTEYLLNDVFPTPYKAQVQGNLMVTDREWWDFMAYRPENTKRPHFIKRIFRDEDYIKEMKIQIIMFVTELNKLVESLTKSEF